MNVMSNTRVVSDIDPFSEEFRADPFRYYAQLRALGPIVWLEKYGIWVVQHYAQVRSVLMDFTRFSNAGGGGLTNYFKEPNWRQPSIILEVDPPDHERTRKVMMRLFTPGALQKMRTGFTRVAEELVDAAIARGSVEAVSELVQPFPMTVFPDAVGMSPFDREIMLVYGGMVFGGFGPRTPWYDELMSRAEEVGAWINAHCERSALTMDGLGATIYEAADRGEITDAEAKLLVRSFLSAGVDTTIDSIGLCLRALAEHPDQWAILREDPSLARAAFEEATRYDSSSQSLFRTTTGSFEFEGQVLGKHEKVLVLIGSAGRDPLAWEEPDRFDIQRRITKQTGYGVGIHVCVAQMMARLEGEVFFRALAEKVDRLEMAGLSTLRLHPGLRGLTSLPILLTGKY
ncbi:cytochrome P450 [Gluconobacter thailandicus]|uniref:Cytochrome P450 n=1 Tax=Gluconobacter thailandicus TaxID=257438 RepID=A0AAP9ET39_GLUTH|nr:cytochrome P450 [Gluconobacter thailandicus]QEH96850.1 cytochrome P450 [Gluconobacter thailandicus]